MGKGTRITKLQQQGAEPSPRLVLDPEDVPRMDSLTLQLSLHGCPQPSIDRQQTKAELLKKKLVLSDGLLERTVRQAGW